MTWQKLYEAVQEIETLHKIDLVDFDKAGEDFKNIAQKGACEILDGQIRRKN